MFEKKVSKELLIQSLEAITSTLSEQLEINRMLDERVNKLEEESKNLKAALAYNAGKPQE